MKIIEVTAKPGTLLPFGGTVITDKAYVSVELSFGVRRLLADGSLIEKPKQAKKDKGGE